MSFWKKPIKQSHNCVIYLCPIDACIKCFSHPTIGYPSGGVLGDEQFRIVYLVDEKIYMFMYAMACLKSDI